MKWFLTALGKYADFSGRAGRSEYWYYLLFANIIFPFGLVLFIALFEFVGLLGGSNRSLVVSASQWLLVTMSGMYGLVMLLPGIAVTVRRLHDIGASGWWYLVIFIPFAGIALLVMLTVDSEAGPNKYGPNPKDAGGLLLASYASAMELGSIPLGANPH